MLNPFPIQWLVMLAYFILRLFVVVSLYIIAKHKIVHYRELVTSTHWPLLPQHALPIQLLIITELGVAFFLLIGMGTQYAALVLIALSVKMLLWHKRFEQTLIPPRLVYFLLLGCGLCLFITGAGVLAIDLPI